MPGKPKPDGLKLSMLTEPRLNRNRPGAVSWNSQKVPSGEFVDDESQIAPRSLAETRLIADAIDLIIVVPIAVVLLIGLPVWYAAVDDGPEHHASYGAVGLFVILIPYCLPLAALLYGLLSYGIFGTTLGKRKMKIRITAKAGDRASRRSLLFRPLANWGSFLATALLSLVGVAVLSAVRDFEQPTGGLPLAMFIIFMFFNPIAVILFHIGIRVFTRAPQSNLVDRLTRTEIA